MITVRAGSGAIGVCLLLALAGCSREQQDWRSAESADTIESYGQFIQRHPESELATQARARVAQLGEDRDWQHAGSADTVDAYRDFLAQHPNGKWSQEAHIRIENFSLGEQAGTDAGSKAASTGGGVGGAGGDGSAATGARSYGLAEPGDAATPVGSTGASASGAPSGTRRVAAAPGVAGSTATVAASGAAATAATAGAAAAAGGVVGGKASPAAQASSSSGGPKGAYGIQLGAFTTEAGATAQWRTLTSKYVSELQGLHQHLVPADTASGRIYRLQATVGDEGRARSICDQLKKRGQACVAVLPH